MGVLVYFSRVLKIFFDVHVSIFDNTGHNFHQNRATGESVSVNTRVQSSAKESVQ